MTPLCFCRRREDWLGQLRRLLQSGWKFDSANALQLLIFLPPGAGEIATHHAFHRQRLRFPDDHRTSSKLFAKRQQILRKLLESSTDEVIVDIIKTLEPERGNLVEHRALVWNRVG